MLSDTQSNANIAQNGIDKLEKICDEMEIPAQSHCVRILVKPTTILTSKNPHILLKIAKWHKEQTQCIAFDLHVSTTTTNEIVFKISLSNKNIINNQQWKTQLNEYIHTTTSYKLHCITDHFMSWISL